MSREEELKQDQLDWLNDLKMSDSAIFFQETYTMMLALEEINDIECDQLYVQKAREVVHQLGKSVREYYKEEDGWHWQIHGIADGTFPLEKLPEHVRELAKELYYD